MPKVGKLEKVQSPSPERRVTPRWMEASLLKQGVKSEKIDTKPENQWFNSGKKGGKSVKSLNRKANQMVKKDAMARALMGYSMNNGSKNLMAYVSLLDCSCRVLVNKKSSLKFQKRCGQRICDVCNSIRQAKMVELMLPVLREIEDVGMLVLTQSSKELLGVKDPEVIRKFATDMFKELDLIKRTFDYRFGRKPDTIDSMEANPEGWKYDKKTGKSLGWRPTNPHINLVGRYQDLKWIKQEWLNRQATRERKEINQELTHTRKTENEEELISSLKELVKYPIKTVNSPHRKNKKEQDGELSEPDELSLSGVDILVSAFTRFRRVRSSGMFYNVGKSIEKISEEDIENIDLVSQEYYDIPFDGVSEDLVELPDGSFIPEFIELPEYRWCNNSQNWKYKSVLDGKEYYLIPNRKKIDYKLKIYDSREKPPFEKIVQQEVVDSCRVFSENQRRENSEKRINRKLKM